MKHLTSSLAGMEELGAFIDGELDSMTYASMASAIYSDMDATAMVTDLRDQNAGLRGLLHSILDEPVPARMQMLVNGYAREWRQAS